jgi:hypothetical protein
MALSKRIEVDLVDLRIGLKVIQNLVGNYSGN